MNDDLGVADFDKFRAYITGNAWHAYAGLFADVPHRPGRRRRFAPHVLLLFWYGTAFVWKSARKTATEFANRETWGVLRDLVHAAHPNEPDLWLPERPPKRHHYLYFRRNHMDPAANEVAALHEELALGQMLALGLCDPDGPGSWNHPDKTRTLTADGKVITPLFRSQKPTRVDRSTGEIIPVRHDPDAKPHKTGDRRTVFGNKFQFLHARGADPHARIVLSVRPVDGRGEAKTLLDTLDRLVPRLSGVQALAHDGALRGVHLQHILANLGIIPVVPAHGTKADEKPAPRQLDQTASGAALYTHLGALGQGHLTENGDIAFERMDKGPLHRRPRAGGTVAWYRQYMTADGKELTVRLDQTAQDKLRGINRTEHLRVFSQGDAVYEELMGLRSDSEALNRALEDTLFINRAHSVGHDRQLVDTIGFATGINAVAMFRSPVAADAPPTEQQA